MNDEIERARDLIKGRDSAAALTGAGVSAESGIPTFRGGGESAVWKGMPFDEISSARMVREDLEAVWEWFDHRRGLYKDCLPNPAHHTLVEWQKRFQQFTLVTQNVDGLHNRAGSTEVIELHGNVNRARCVECDATYRLEPDVVPHEPTNCSSCGSAVRPDVVLFGEMLPPGAFETAVDAVSECDVFFLIGTSAIVYPAAGLAEIASSGGSALIEINPESTPFSDLCDVSLRGRAGEILPKL